MTMNETETTGYADVASWEMLDSMWARIEPLLPKVKSRYRGRGKQRQHIGGRPAADRRRVMRGILYVMRTGCQWNALPKAAYGSGKTAHSYFQHWTRVGVFRRMWRAGLTEYDDLKGIAWKWQAADGVMTKAPLGGQKTGPNPTDRAKRGTKRSLLVDAQGVRLGLVVSGANTPDAQLLEATVTSRPVARPDLTETPPHLCLDKAYSDTPSAEVAQAHGYELHVPDKANAKKTQAQTGPAQTASLDCRSRAFLDKPLSSAVGALGEESVQLPVIALFRLCHHLLAQV
jgi:putative transposase